MRIPVAVAVIVLVAVVASRGQAQGEATGAAGAERASIEVARSHMEQGQAYYLQGRFGEAAAEFEAAYEAEPFSAFLYNAAVAYENAGDAVRAVDFFSRYLERDPNASDRSAVEQRIARLRAVIATATAEAQSGSGADTIGSAATGTTAGTASAGGEPGAVTASEAGTGAGSQAQPLGTSGTAAPPPEGLPEDFKSLVSVRTTPEGATVIVTSEQGGEVARGYSPFSCTLDQGRYHLRIEHPDFNVAQQDISIDPGKVYVIFVNLSQGEFLGYLRIVTDPPGAQVFVDDREAGMRGQTPYEASFPVGTHHVWIERSGYAPIERDAEVRLGSTVDLRVELERVAFGRMRVLSNLRGARVSVDGRYVGTVPFEGELPAGDHQLRVEGEGMKAFTQTVTISRGQLTPVRVRMRPDVGRGGGWVAGAFGLVALGGGIAMAVISNDFYQQVVRAREAGALASDDDRLETGFFLAIGADAAFGVSLILGILAVYYFAYDPLPPSEGTVLEPRDWTLAPFVDPVTGAAGAGIAGRF